MFAKSRMRVRLVPIVAVAAGVALALSACSGSAVTGGGGGSTPNAGGTFKIGFVTSQTGAFSSVIGASTIQGSELATQVINKENLAGRQVTVVSADDGTATDTAFQVCTRFATTDHVDAVVGANSAAESAACNQALAAKGIPFIQVSQVAGNFCAANMWTTGPANSQLIIPLTKYLLGKGSKSFYLIGSDTAAPHAGFQVATQTITASGGKVVGTDFVPPSTTDYSGYISRIAAAKPDAILDAITDAGEIQFLKASTTDPRLQGTTKGSFIAASSLIKAVGPSVKGFYVQGPFFNTLTTPAADAYLSALKKKFGAKADTGPYGSYAYVGMLTLAAAVKHAGSSDSKDVLAALHSGVSVKGPAGTVKTGPEYGNFAYQPNLIAVADSTGTLKVVSTTSLAPTGTCTVK